MQVARRAEALSPGREASLQEYRARVARALAFIQENLDGELDLEAAARAACFSPFHFHRIFGAVVGETFADHVRRLRLERAANLLDTRPGMSVTEAALSSGFSSPSLFSRDFRSRFGLPPSRWRELRDEARAAYAPSVAPEAAGSAVPGALSGTLSVMRLPALRFASVFSISGYGPGIAEASSRLFRWAGPRGLLGPETRMAGISWDNPEITPAERCRYSVCVDLPPGMEVSGEIVLLEFPARSYLALAYSGPESGLGPAYAELYKRHLPESGFEPEDAPAIEFYRRPPGPEGLFELEIALPVRPLGA